MAQDRFYFWRGYYDALATLPTDAQRGRFVMAVCQYAFEDEVPDLSDDPILMFAWVMVRDQVAESVEMGRRQSERGSKGGRPQKSGAKSGAKSTVKTTAKSGVKSGAKSTAESEEKRRELSSTCVEERVGANALAPDGAALAQRFETPALDVPPKPEGA